MINVIADRRGEERRTICMLECDHIGTEVVPDTLPFQCAPFPRCFLTFARYAIRYRCNDKELRQPRKDDQRLQMERSEGSHVAHVVAQPDGWWGRT